MTNYQTNVQEFAIGGQLLTISYNLNDIDSWSFSNEDNYKKYIKKQMAEFMATFILENNLAEYTSFNDPITLTKVLNMRCYLAPHDQVKILRVHSPK